MIAENGGLKPDFYQKHRFRVAWKGFLVNLGPVFHGFCIFAPCYIKFLRSANACIQRRIENRQSLSLTIEQYSPSKCSRLATRKCLSYALPNALFTFQRELFDSFFFLHQRFLMARISSLLANNNTYRSRSFKPSAGFDDSAISYEYAFVSQLQADCCQ